MNRPKARGTAAETAVVRWLRENGWLYAERRALRGRLDVGDVTGLPGVVIEIVDEKGLDGLTTKVKEMLTEKANADAEVGFVVKRWRGKTDPGDWLAVLPLADLNRLLLEVDGRAGDYDRTFGGATHACRDERWWPGHAPGERGDGLS